MDVDARRRKLQFRAAHRGMRELDLFVGAFANARVPRMSQGELDEFERILDLPDNTVLDWITGRARPPSDDCGPVLTQLLGFEYPFAP